MKLFVASALALCLPLFLVAASSGSPEPATSTVPNAWSIDPGHSAVVFKTKHLGTSYFYGRFNDVSGTVQYDPKSPTKSSIEIVVKADSVDTNDDGRDGHLKNADFFSAKEFPEITFKSKSVKKGSGDTLVVTGDLAFHGYTKEVQLDVEIVGTTDHPRFGKRAGFHTELQINPGEDFGVKYMASSEAVGPLVDLMISLEVVKS